MDKKGKKGTVVSKPGRKGGDFEIRKDLKVPRYLFVSVRKNLIRLSRSMRLISKHRYHRVARVLHLRHNPSETKGGEDSFELRSLIKGSLIRSLFNKQTR